MNFKIVLLLSALFIISVQCKKGKSSKKAAKKQVNQAVDQINNSIIMPIDNGVVRPAIRSVNDKKLEIPDITAQCSKLVKNLNVKGIEAYVPTEKEAKENMEELGKILKIVSIKDEAEKRAKFADHPELKKLLEKLKKIKGLQLMSEKDQENALKSNEEMLETVVRLSMLDTTNRKSPIYGKNISKLLGKTEDKIQSNVKDKIKPSCKAMKRKYINRDGKMRLIFSKVIPPGHKMPNGNNIMYTDEKGRKCYCSC